MRMPCPISDQQKQVRLWESTPEPLPDGQKMEKSKPSKPKVGKGVTRSPNTSYEVVLIPRRNFQELCSLRPKSLFKTGCYGGVRCLIYRVNVPLNWLALRFPVYAPPRCVLAQVKYKALDLCLNFCKISDYLNPTSSYPISPSSKLVF